MEKKKEIKQKIKKIKSVNQLKNIVENMLMSTAGLNIIVDLEENKLYISANLCAKMKLLTKNNYIEFFTIKDSRDFALIPCHKDFSGEVSPFLVKEEDAEYPISFGLSDEPNGYGIIYHMCQGKIESRNRYLFPVLPQSLEDKDKVTRHYFRMKYAKNRG